MFSVFHSELFVFSAFCVFCVELDVSFIKFLALHNHCLHNSRFQVFCVFVLTYLKQFVRKDTHHKNLTIVLNKSL